MTIAPLSTTEKAMISCISIFTLYSSYFTLILCHKSDLLTTLCQSIGAAMSIALLGLLASLVVRHKH
jgi:hypothetical protein